MVSVNNESHNTIFEHILQFDWSLYTTGASPRILTCDTRSLLLTWAGWGLGTRLFKIIIPAANANGHTCVLCFIKNVCSLMVSVVVVAKTMDKVYRIANPQQPNAPAAVAEKNTIKLVCVS